MDYKCEHCHDTGFCTGKRLDDGTEIKVFCYCHPLVRKGVVKALDGGYALDKVTVSRKGVARKKEVLK